MYMYMYMYIIEGSNGNMDRWKSRGGKGQRRAEKKQEDQRRERVRRTKMQVREKVEKSRITVFFQWFVAQEGRKVGSLKRRVQSHLARWDMKNCTIARRCGPKNISKPKCTKPQLRSIFKSWDVGTLLEVETSKKCTPWWRQAHFQVKTYNAHHARGTFGSWDIEKVHAVVARSTFPSQHVKKC